MGGPSRRADPAVTASEAMGAIVGIAWNEGWRTMLLSSGPVAQRPTADGGFPAGNGGPSEGLTPKLTPAPVSDAALELLVAALSPLARLRLRVLLGGGVAVHS